MPIPKRHHYAPQMILDVELGALVQSFVLLRKALIKMIDEGAMPTQAELGRLLFCGDAALTSSPA